MSNRRKRRQGRARAEARAWLAYAYNMNINKFEAVPLTADDCSAILAGLTHLSVYGAAVSEDLFQKVERAVRRIERRNEK